MTTVLETAKQKVVDLEKESAKNQPKIADVLKNLEAAITKKDGPMLDLYYDRVDDTSALIVDTLRHSTAALAALAELRKDKEFMETKFEVVKALTLKVEATKTRLTEQLVKIKDLQKKANKAMDALQGGQDEAVAKYAELEARVNDKKKQIEKKHKELQALVALADKAVSAKNQKGLTDARTKIIGLFGDDKIQLGVLDRDIKTFLVKYKNAGLNTDANWLKDEVYKMQSIVEDGEAERDRLLKLGQIQAAAPPASKAPELSNAEIAKAGKALGFESKDNAKLGKILNDMPRDKWAAELGKLAKTAGLKETDGKVLLQQLNKLDFIKKMFLIDI